MGSGGVLHFGLGGIEGMHIAALHSSHGVKLDVDDCGPPLAEGYPACRSQGA